MIARRVIQWRARYHCGRGGRLGLTVIQGSQRRTLTDAGCPRDGTSTGFRTGVLQLGVKASGSWRVTIHQQITSALHEQPLAAMRSSKARVVSRGASTTSSAWVAARHRCTACSAGGWPAH